VIHLIIGITAACLLVPLAVIHAERVVVVGFSEGKSGEGLETLDAFTELEALSEFEPARLPATVEAMEVSSLEEIPSDSDVHGTTVAVEVADVGVIQAGALMGEVRYTNTAAPAAGQLREAGSVEEAVDGVVGDIRGRLERGDLLAVWLFDASISLLDDRRRVAERLHSMFDAIAASSPSHTLRNAAVAFGGSTRPLVGPTTNGARIVNAVRDVPIDRSGTENVLAAVESVVNKYTRHSQHQMMVVVWTDESGDDLDKLEAVIDACRQHDVAVSVVGPSAMLSRKMGTHVFRDPSRGKVLFLPIERGPDSATSQRLHLPYWYATSMPPWAAAAAPNGAAGLPSWYGGEQMERLSSGFGPYALTRLALATGGTYTVFDAPADRGPFRLETMRPYRPDYRRSSFIADDLQRHPLRQAVLDVVARSLETDGLGPPAPAFFAAGPAKPGGPRMTIYYPPSRFHARLRGEMKRQRTQAKEALAMVDGLVARFGPDGMEEEYQQETSPRWRAWYDLTRGRLLAASVRYAEYAVLADLLSRRGSLATETNHILLRSSQNLRGPDAVHARADEARRLLHRCVEMNPHTPWAYLAQRELDHPLGIDIRQVVLPPPVAVPAVGGPVAPAGPTPQPSLPSL
jgi:hypothetical protein